MVEALTKGPPGADRSASRNGDPGLRRAGIGPRTATMGRGGMPVPGPGQPGGDYSAPYRDHEQAPLDRGPCRLAVRRASRFRAGRRLPGRGIRALSGLAWAAWLWCPTPGTTTRLRLVTRTWSADGGYAGPGPGGYGEPATRRPAQRRTDTTEKRARKAHQGLPQAGYYAACPGGPTGPAAGHDARYLSRARTAGTRTRRQEGMRARRLRLTRPPRRLPGLPSRAGLPRDLPGRARLPGYADRHGYQDLPPGSGYQDLPPGGGYRDLPPGTDYRHPRGGLPGAARRGCRCGDRPVRGHAAGSVTRRPGRCRWDAGAPASRAASSRRPSGQGDEFAPDRLGDGGSAPDRFASGEFAHDGFAPDGFAGEGFAPDGFAPDGCAKERRVRGRRLP